MSEQCRHAEPKEPPCELCVREALYAEHQRLKDAVVMASLRSRKGQPVEVDGIVTISERWVNAHDEWKAEVDTLAAFEAQHPEVVK